MTDEIRCDGIFDAKLVRENKSAKGIFLTLEIAADDYYAAKLSDVRPGAVLKIGYREMLNVEVEPIEVGVIKTPPENNAKVIEPKRKFSGLPLSQQAALRCEDEEFIRYLTEWYPNVMKEYGHSASEFVRSYCGVSSRAELNNNPGAAKKWGELERAYQDWRADQRHAESIRR